MTITETERDKTLRHTMTTAPSLTWEQIKALHPCDQRIRSVRAKIKAAWPDDYQTRAMTLADADKAGVGFDDLIWIAGRYDERKARLFACDCAARVSHLAVDPRSHEAIRVTRLFARGEVGSERLAAANDAAGAAANDAAGAAARSAARYAAGAEAAARSASAYAAGAEAAAWDAEKKWQKERLIEWFSDVEPDDWPVAFGNAMREEPKR